MEKYGYSQNVITSLKDIDTNSTNFYTYNNLHFLSKQKKNNTNLVIFFHGIVPLPLDPFEDPLDRIVFRGYGWEIEKTDIVCISDYLLGVYKDWITNWWLPTKNYDVDKIYKNLFTYLINNKSYDNIIFTGTSAGGYPSIKYASYFNCNALVSNTQTYPQHYTLFPKMVKILKNNGDKLLYTEKEIEKYILEGNMKKLTLFFNIKDVTFKTYIPPFINFIYKDCKKLKTIFDIHLFSDNAILPENRDYHYMTFPNGKKHLEILKNYLKKL